MYSKFLMFAHFYETQTHKHKSFRIIHNQILSVQSLFFYHDISEIISGNKTIDLKTRKAYFIKEGV